MIRRRINDLMGLTGYRIVSNKPSIARDVSLGRFDWIRERGIRTVLDVGANTGQFASFVRQILPEAHIHAFEPLAICQNQLRKQAEVLHPMTCHEYGLGDQNGKLRIHHTAASPSSSMLPVSERHKDTFPSSRTSSEEVVSVRMLDTVAPGLRFEPGLLLKIDVQGYELHVLRGGEETLRSVETLIVETSYVTLYEGQPLFDDIYRYVVDRGFHYRGSIEKIVDPKNGEILQEDSVFFNGALGQTA